MGTVFVDNLEPQSGTSLTLGASGDTVNLGSGGTVYNTPAFFAWENTSGQSLTQDSAVKIQFDQEVFDTDSAYDTSNYRFTVPTGKGGKYYFHSTINLSTNSNDGDRNRIYFYKNGSQITFTNNNQNTAGNWRHFQITGSIILDLSAGDYIEIYGYTGGSSPYVQAQTDNYETYFMGYRLIGA